MKKLLYVVIIFVSISGFSQTKKIKILSADNTFVKPEYPGATISVGNVFIEHEGATLRCDKAYIYQEKKLVKAMGNVVI
ncbi:MAG: OstA-like protein, partial [Lutibacter sp.]|nr:OstA-like protein [Lutibacter sp.]